MNKTFHGILLLMLLHINCKAQSGSQFQAADLFLRSLSKSQQLQAVYPISSDERFVWGYIPKTDRKGVSLNEMDATQKKAAVSLMKLALSNNGVKKAQAIMGLEKVLKRLENRAADDNYRDTGKYYFTLFGKPSAENVWGWRLDGHHLSYSFTIKNNMILAGTPGFFGANPAVVLSGPEKGLEILKEETQLGLQLVHSFNAEQMGKATISDVAPGDIVTAANRVASIQNPKGILYSDLTPAQQTVFMQLLSLYIHRYTRLFADRMMQKIETAGLNHLIFSWAGSTEDGIGHPKYYRIQGPAIIIEYDNTQNNANHIHTVIRDLTSDFGGDDLLSHYQSSHHQ